MTLTYATLGRNGRLGNQFFQIASTIGISRLNNRKFAFPDWQYARYFTKSLPPMTFMPEVTLSEIGYSYKPYRIDQPGDFNLNGYFQSHKFFTEEEAREYLSFRPDIEAELCSRYNLENSVSIHVRRGDYLKVTHLYEVMTADYYRNALETLEYDRVLVFSDDIDWCRENLDFIDNPTFVEGNSDIEDLIIMSNCKHNIISNSTFSWWAAYLNKNPEKRVLYPERWFKLPNAEVFDFVYEDLIPDSWEKIHY